MFYVCFRDKKGNFLRRLIPLWQGLAARLAGSWGMDTVRRVHFGVFLTSRLAPPALSSDWILLINCGNSLDGIVGFTMAGYILGE